MFGEPNGCSQICLAILPTLVEFHLFRRFGAVQKRVNLTESCTAQNNAEYAPFLSSIRVDAAEIRPAEAGTSFQRRGVGVPSASISSLFQTPIFIRGSR
jgi:hypothetical protein